MNDTIKILVADDEAIGRQLLEAILMPEGYELVFGEDGQEALDVALQEAPDIILLDVMMPKLDGFEVCKKLRENDSTLHTPVFLITALDDRDSRIRGIDAGADDYISKPFDRVEILGKIKNRTISISRKKQESGTTTATQTEASNSSALLPLLFTKMLASKPAEEIILVRSGKIDESQHACLSIPHSQGQHVAFLSNKLNPIDSPVANAILANIIVAQAQQTLTNSPSKIVQKSVLALNEFIAEQKSDLLSEAGFSFAIAGIQAEATDCSIAGINQMTFIKQNNMLSPGQGSEFQPYYLQGNQDLQFSKPTEGIIFSSNITDKFPQQELITFMNKHLMDQPEKEFKSQTQNKFKEINDFLVARLIL